MKKIVLSSLGILSTFCIFVMICHWGKSSMINQPQVPKLILVPRPEIVSDINASSLIESIDYVFLSTIPNSIIAEVSDLLVINDTIVVFDKKLGNVLTFSMAGNFIAKIGIPSDYGGHKIMSISRFDNGILLNLSKEKFASYIDLKGYEKFRIPTSEYKLLFGSIDSRTFWSYFPFINIKFNKNEYFQYSNLTGDPRHRFIRPLYKSRELRDVPIT